MDINNSLIKKNILKYDPFKSRNITNNCLIIISICFTLITVLPLFLLLGYIIIKGINNFNLSLLTETAPPPGFEFGGIGHAILGTLFVTFIASVISIPVGVGGGIYLAEYSSESKFANFIRFGVNVLSGVPSIIAGVFVYSTVVTNRIVLGNSYSAIAGGIALSILMLPMIIRTTDEALKLVPIGLKNAAIAIGASKSAAITRVILPSAFYSITTGIVLAIARAAGETAPLVFTALYSPFWPEGISSPIGTLSVLIYNFATMPFDFHNDLAWAASFILILLVLLLNLVARQIGNMSAFKS